MAANLLVKDSEAALDRVGYLAYYAIMQTEQTYETNRAAYAAGIDVGTLRTWQRQGVILHCGEEPRPSYPRAYPIEGVYEMALLNAMTRHGIKRSLAMRIARAEIAKWLAVDNPETPELLRSAYQRTKRIMTEYRDMAKPAVLVIGADDSYPDDPIPCAVDYAHGWDDVQRAINDVRGQGAPYIVKSQPRDGKSATPITPGKPFRVIQAVDITSTLADVDARLVGAAKS